MKLTVNEETKEIMKPVTVTSRTFNISLDAKEALALLLVLRATRGEPNSTARKYIDTLVYTLTDELNRLTEYKATWYGDFELFNNSYFTPKSLKWVDDNAKIISAELQ